MSCGFSFYFSHARDCIKQWLQRREKGRTKKQKETQTSTITHNSNAFPFEGVSKSQSKHRHLTFLWGLDTNLLASFSSLDTSFFMPTKLPPKSISSSMLFRANAVADRASSFSTHATLSQPQFCNGMMPGERENISSRADGRFCGASLLLVPASFPTPRRKKIRYG